jgi:hypothetical protein
MRNLLRHFNRHEFSGAFGDVGTDLPLITGMILASGMNPASVLGVFGAAQVASALFYGIPMPVQPLKAVAALVIAGGISAPQVYGAGLTIGVVMLLLTATGLLDRLRAIVPHAVIRGLQLGLGLKLALLSALRYIPANGPWGIALALFCGIIILLLLKNRHCPPALPVIGIGLLYVWFVDRGNLLAPNQLGITLPTLVRFTPTDMLQGFLLLALPQIPLSLGNSLFATHQMATDLFPQSKIRLRTIGYTYGILNICSAPLGGIPVCHGTGGMAGHYIFGGRTGGSVFIYGILLILLGLFWGSGFGHIVQIFPLSVLGIILLTESGMLMHLARDVIPLPRTRIVAIATALMAAFLPYGFLIGMIAGSLLEHTLTRTIPNGDNP